MKLNCNCGHKDSEHSRNGWRHCLRCRCSGHREPDACVDYERQQRWVRYQAEHQWDWI